MLYVLLNIYLKYLCLQHNNISILYIIMYIPKHDVFIGIIFLLYIYTYIYLFTYILNAKT